MDSLIEIPLTHRLEWAHSPRLVGAEFSADGQTVFVHMHTPMLDILGAIASVSFFVAIVILIVANMIGLIWVLRIRQTPRKVGLP